MLLVDEVPISQPLPTSYYTDPAHYEREREQLLWSNWVAVSRLEDLARPGDYVTFDHAGEPLLVVHGQDGELRAFPNVCRHRLTTIVEGCGHARAFQCPYHLWTYDLAGRLVGAPGMEDTEGFERSDFGLPELGLDTWGGWVFVHLDPAARPLLGLAPQLEATYPGAYLERLVRVGRTHCHSPWNWKIVVENFGESYHHAGTHPKTLQPTFPYAQIREVENHGEPWSSIEHAPSAPGVEPFTATSVYPTHLFALNRPFGMFWFQLEVHGHDSVDLDIQAFVIPELAGEEKLANEMIAGLETINNEDLAINARIWKGLHSRLAKFGPLSSYEEGIRRFRGWMVSALAD